VAGLGRWLLAATDALELDRFHLVVHDIGGPIGFGLAHAAPERVPGAFAAIMRLVGVSRHVPTAEIACWLPLLFGEDNGRAFPKIMRGFQLTEAGRRRYLDAVRNTPYPVQIVWGERDRRLPWRRYGVQAQLASGVEDATLLPTKHFVQEDCRDEVAAAVHRFIAS
jgi:haloalkane dehalogenase